MIVKVSHNNKKVAYLLTTLQHECLPYDDTIKFHKGQIWWVYYYRKEPIAFACLQPSCRWGNTMYLSRAGVIKEYRGRGIQKKLIKERIKEAKALGYEWLITDTSNNVESANNLISCGFKTFYPSVKWAKKNSIYWKYKL